MNSRESYQSSKLNNHQLNLLDLQTASLCIFTYHPLLGAMPGINQTL